MSEELLCAQHNTGETFVNTVCSNQNKSFDFGKCCRYVDKIKPVLGPSLEGRIHSILKEFVYEQNSQHPKCSSWVKKWLETTTAWVDCMDAFLTKDTPVGEEMIKCAINYVAKGGLVTQFADSLGFNNRASRMRQELDSLALDQNILKTMNVWRYINEKDYWLSRDCADTTSTDTSFSTSPENSNSKDSCNSDLEVEVGSCSKQICERRRGYSRNEQNRSDSSKSSSWGNLPNCFCNLNVDTRRKHEKISLNKFTHDCDHRHRVRRKNPKLKTFIYQNRNVSNLAIPGPMKVTYISIPCRPNQLIVRIFETDPSLPDSCLILMKKKFENGIRNVCSRLNEILRKLDDAEVKELRLVCEIRPGYIDLNLRRPRTSKPRLFLARLPTCRSHPKREPCCKHTNSCEDSRSRCGELRYRGNSISVDCCSNDKEKNKKFDKEKRSFIFHTSRSNCSSTNEKDCTSSQDKEMNARMKKKVSRKEVDFVSARKSEKEVCFNLLNVQKVKESDISDDNNNKRCKSDAAGCNVSRLNLNGKREDGELRNNCIEQTAETIIKQEARCNESIGEKMESNAESFDSNSNRYSDSLKENERIASRENCSSTEICNPQQCLCHILNAKNNASMKENADCLNYSKPQSIEEKDSEKSSVESCYSGEDTFKSKEPVSQAKVKEGSNAEQDGDGIIRSEESNLSIKQNISEPKKRTAVTKRSAEVAEKYSVDSIYSLNSNYTEVSCGTKCSCCGEDLTNAERIEIESENFTISIESKITAKGKASSGDATNKKKSTVEFFKSKAKGDTKAEKTFFIQGPSTTTSSVNNFATQQSKRKTTKHDKSVNRIPSIESRPIKVLEICNPSVLRSLNCNTMPDPNNKGRVLSAVSNGPSKFSRTCAEICENGQSLAARRTNTKQFSCRSNVSINLDSLGDDFRVRSREWHTRPGSPYRPSSTRTKLRRKSRHSTRFTVRAPSYSTQDLRGIDCASESRRDVKVRNYSRCPRRNRFRSAASGYLCGSFPAASIDRLKYLIRKKLRRLLLEQRDKGTNTSKTFIRSERYLVSISSGKLNEERVIRDTCSVDRLNRHAARDQDGESGKTFGSNVSSSKKDTLERVPKKRYQSIFQRDVIKKLKINQFSRVLSPKRVSKLMDAYNLTGRREKGARRTSEAKSVANADSSSNMFLDENDPFRRLRNANKKQLTEEYAYFDKIICERRQSLRSKRDLKKCRGNCCACGSSTNSYDERIKRKVKNKKLFYNNFFGGTENTLKLNDLKLLRRHFQSSGDPDKDFAIFCRDYEKYVSYIYADFKLKLLQYVALCRNVKDTLIERLRSDNSCEIRSSSK